MKSPDYDKDIALLCKFLRDNGVLDKFCKNKLAYHHDISLEPNMSLGEKTKRIVTYCMNDYYMGCTITDAGFPWIEYFVSCSTCFPWGSSPEGSGFWLKISKKWVDYRANELIKRSTEEARREYEEV